MKKKIIEFNNYSFKYYSQQDFTLKNINLSIYEGEKILILGESGSGKSTLCNAINGLVPFFYNGTSDGSLKIFGKECKDMSIFEISKVVGTVLQDPDSQFTGLTAAEDIAFKLENICVDNKTMKEKVENISKLVDMENYLNSNPHQLSGGQKQRVTLAGSIIDDINILLFDEPLASLDPKTGNTAIELIDSIKNKTNKTVIIIEHRLEDVLHCHIDRIVLMHEGKIVFTGTPSEILCSNILTTYGIREPLYISALKYANCNITKDLNIEDLQNLKYEKIKDNLTNWYKNQLESKNPILPKDSILRIENINFSYNEKVQIIKNLSFDIKKGELVCIAGKNGAGKSTISKIICGFVKNYSGNIFYENNDISNKSVKEIGEIIGFVMQNPNQMISCSMIYEEVASGLKLKNISDEDIEKRVNETLKICGLYEMRKWPISALSFGQKKRVTIASILVMNPKILILDEPTAGQDFKHYSFIMEFILKLNREFGITIIMITHDMHLLLEYSDRCIVMFDGIKLYDGDATHVLSDFELINKANLKKTSLYTLAEKSEIKDISKFIDRFIKYDRSTRNK